MINRAHSEARHELIANVISTRVQHVNRSAWTIHRANIPRITRKYRGETEMYDALEEGSNSLRA